MIEKEIKELPKYLGGHGNITHIDEGALIYLKAKFNVSLMLDVGCGVGGMLKIASKHGIIAAGIDGDFTAIREPYLAERIEIHDYNTGSPKIQTLFDLIWSVEFLEHVEEKYLSNVFNTLKKAKIVFCTANPGKNKFHFNPQSVNYWIKKFEKNGFEYLKRETKEIKVVSTMNRTFVKDTGMIFKNKEL